MRRVLQFGMVLVFGVIAGRAEIFILPTPNRALLETGPGEKYLVGTTGKPWPSGAFGCVRTQGLKMHEGLDIRCVRRDRSGEPIDPIFASAAGTVVYVSRNAGLSNYGRYIVLRHQIEGLAICTLYAHLSDIAEGLSAGDSVRQGQVIATMGRTANTREGISKERAHLHFEINFQLSDRYAPWHAKFTPSQRNDHGMWNGLNMAAVDPAAVFLAQKREGAAFSLVNHFRQRKEAFRVMVRDGSFSFLRHYPALVKRNPSADREGAAGYEISLDFNGAPIELIPRTASEIRSSQRIQLLSVNAAEFARHKCCKLVVRRRGNWELTTAGQNRMELLIY